jgi:RNA polymerase sigma factor FliA
VLLEAPAPTTLRPPREGDAPAGPFGSARVDALWRDYRVTGDRAGRDRLVLALAPLVRFIVFRKVRELPSHCDVEDLVSVGLEAVIPSLDRFDPGRGRSLEQFVWQRVHGAILDELRRGDFAPRSLRRWQRRLGRARTDLARELGRAPTREELAERLNIAPQRVDRYDNGLIVTDVTSLNAVVAGEEDSAVERIDTLASEDPAADPEEAALAGETRDRFRAAFDRLPERQRHVAVLLYVQDLTLREAGDVLGVSESRVCQLHSELKRTLRDALDGEAFAAA